MRKVSLTLFVLGAIALPGVLTAEEAVETVDVPADVEALVFRSASCWSTSHTGHASTAQSEAERLSLKCYAIAEDEAALRQKYQSNPRVLKALDFMILPADVNDLLHRRTGCNELTKTASEQPNPSHESGTARLYLKCDSVASDEAALRQRYSGDARVLKVLDGIRVRFITIVPLKIAPQTGPADTSKGPSYLIDR